MMVADKLEVIVLEGNCKVGFEEKKANKHCTELQFIRRAPFDNFWDSGNILSFKIEWKRTSLNNFSKSKIQFDAKFFLACQSINVEILMEKKLLACLGIANLRFQFRIHQILIQW